MFRWIGMGGKVGVQDVQVVCITAWIEDRLECGMAKATGIKVCLARSDVRQDGTILGRARLRGDETFLRLPGQSDFT